MTVHKRIGRSISVIILVVTLAVSSSLTALGAGVEKQDAKEGRGYVSGQLLVLYKGDMTNGQVEAMAKEQGDEGAEVIFQTGDSSIVLVSLSDDVSVEQAAEEYESDPNVLAATPNYELELFASTAPVNDPQFLTQTYLPQTKVPQAWNLVNDNPHNKVRVAVLDTGVDLTHPDLKNILNKDISKEILNDGTVGPLLGDGFENGKPSPTNGGGHGTHVSGLIAAESNNGVGVAGTGSGLDNSIVELVNVDVFAGDRLTSIEQVVRGLLYAESIDAKVINLSLGAKKAVVGDDDRILQAACEALVESGSVIVTAAGNDNINDNGQVNVVPSDFDNTISVIAVDSANNRSNISNYGALKDISAPGEVINSTAKGGGYTTLTGTSMAAAEVSGIVAMMCSVNPNLDAKKAKEILRSTATDLGPEGFDIYTGMGLINAEKAVKAALDLLAQTEPPVNPIPPAKPDVPVNPAPLPYNDVNPEDWYYEGVSYMYSKGIMTGLSPTIFGPASTLSRAQFATILYRISGAEKVPYSPQFPDVQDNQFYTDAVMWAAGEGIIKGYDNGKFGTSDTVTREQMTVMLHRYVQKLGKDSMARNDLSHFPDFQSISEFARESMSWASAEGIIKGNGNGTLAPLGNADRAASAVMMMRVMTQNLL